LHVGSVPPCARGARHRSQKRSLLRRFANRVRGLVSSLSRWLCPPMRAVPLGAAFAFLVTLRTRLRRDDFRRLARLRLQLANPLEMLAQYRVDAPGERALLGHRHTLQRLQHVRRKTNGQWIALGCRAESRHVGDCIRHPNCVQLG